MHLTLRPDQGEMRVFEAHGVIFIEFDNEDGCVVTVELNIDMANSLIRSLIACIWLNDHAPDLAAPMQEQDMF